MNIQNLLDIQPKILTIIPTHKCTASCEQCCFGCTPDVQQILEFSKIISYIDESIREFSSIELLVVTGGECFLLYEELLEIVKHANLLHLKTRVVTNGYWGVTYDAAYLKLQKLKEAGLTEINFSTGDNHQKYIKFENIVNCAKASIDLEFLNVVVSVETSPNNMFKCEDVKKNCELCEYIENGRLKCMPSAWMQFRRSDNVDIWPKKYVTNAGNPCEHIFKSIIINPYGQLLSCCGLTVENNPYLKMGSVESNSIVELYNLQFDDLFKLWLYVEGPKAIYEYVMSKRKMEPVIFPHECAYCIELVKDANNIKIISENIMKELPTILFRLKTKKIKLNK